VPALPLRNIEIYQKTGITPMADCNCRFCGTPLTETFANLGMSPLSNSFISQANAARMEPFYPLHVFVCGRCFLVQLEQFESPEHIFQDYLYFSSFSDSWLRHAEAYVGQVIDRFGLDARSRVAEVASNDGYLLQYFVQRGITVLGIEPAANVARAAIEKGVPTEVAFFGVAAAERLRSSGFCPDLIIANNVMAHVPDLNDFVRGFQSFLAPQGVLTVEFPHLLRLIQENQFDTIYHEHFSYFSLLFVDTLMQTHGLRLFDVQELSTHGGSLRIFACHLNNALHQTSPSVANILDRERAAGLADLAIYRRFGQQVIDSKCGILEFCLRARRENKRIAGYGAPAKGNTLLNYCGIGPEFIEYTVDRSPHKQGLLLPGSRIPIRAPEHIMHTQPDYVLILPWNLKDEVMQQMSAVRGWGGRFVVPIPRVQVF
jgi:SAM-dependent methyltransferase